MYPGQAPLGRFVLGRVDPRVRAAVAPAHPSLDATIRAGGCRLARVTARARRTGAVVAVLPVLGGSLTITARSNLRRELQADLATDGLDATAAAHLLDPRKDVELHLELGVVRPAGTPVWYPAGVFTLTNAESNEAAPGVVSVHAPDRAADARRHRMLTAVKAAKNGCLEDALASIWAPALAAWLPLKMERNFTALPAALLGGPGEDPFAVASDAAESVGAELVIDRTGTAVLRRPITNVFEVPIRAMHSVDDADTITALTQEVDTSDLPDGCIVRYGSKSGQVAAYPDESRNRYIYVTGDKASIAGAQNAYTLAMQTLAKARREVQTVTASLPADPRLSVDDAIRITGGGADTNIDFVARVEKITITFGNPRAQVTLGERYDKRGWGGGF